MTTEAPTPHLPRGAGGPLRRAAGRVSADQAADRATAEQCSGSHAAIARGAVAPQAVAVRAGRQAALALVFEPDRLARLLVVPAVAALGFRVAECASACGAGLAPSAVFVPLERANDCRRACEEARRVAQGPPAAGLSAASGRREPLVVGYGARAGLLSAHRAHHCADVVLRLTEAAGRPRFRHLPVADAVTAGGLTAREADVLVLLLEGLTTIAVGSRLCVSRSTARTHCRAVLRKLGVGDRRELRALLLAADFEVCLGDRANFAEESAVAARGCRPHT